MPSLPSYALNTLVTALVHSQLDYCNVVFASLPACDIQRLQSVLNTAICLVAGSSRRDHVSSLLRDRHWLPVKQCLEYKLCMMDLITRSAAAAVRTGLGSATSSTVAVPRTKSLLGDRSFAAAGPRAWNKLPPLLCRVSSAATFKSQLKTFLFDHAFN